MFVQNFIKLGAAVYELSCQQENELATMLKTILPSLPRAIIKHNKSDSSYRLSYIIAR